ncbi:MAG: 16S rRNA (adenine(1518)-N(6)/adenine(1519)-N(6))-dimethyltransferase RsmA [Bacteroidales bacterium]|nr:16S rRNA (adenine(1518)-N(6)/adenine(1519)-N(6))-dimethyltransferase RsmA [Bacteroidales bacterium]
MNNFVRPKKHLGQHFLKDENIAKKIVSSLQSAVGSLLEIGPGMGVLTKYLLDLPGIECYFIDTDREAIDYLNNAFPGHEARFIHGDYLRMNTAKIFTGSYAVIGNFPYNISSQIFFRILEERQNVTEVVGMVQKEVAERLAAGPGSKTYGILSVLLQAYYRIEYLFTVNENVFVPPPRVKSAVIRLTRNDTERLDCDEELFFRVVKTAFNQRRKTLRNSLKSFYIDYERGEILHLAGKRAEQLSVEDFVRVTRVAV